MCNFGGQDYRILEEYPVYARKTSNVLGNTHCADHPGPIVMATLSLLCRLLPADTCSYTVMQFRTDHSDCPGLIVPDRLGKASQVYQAVNPGLIVQIITGRLFRYAVLGVPTNLITHLPLQVLP